MTSHNVNTDQYWNDRFSSGNWGKTGSRQTVEYAKANIKEMGLNRDFNGTILDFGCALGDAISHYANSFPKARLIGMDISTSAVEACRDRFGNIAEFISGDHTTAPQSDIIIASHVMEHITDDRNVVKTLLNRCKVMYIFVPYKETPLFSEHVNYYDEKNYHEFSVKRTKVFTVSYRRKPKIKTVLSNLIHLRFNLGNSISKQIILFELSGNSARTDTAA